MDFVAIDVETANPRMRSICQVGIVKFEAGREVYAERFMVDPAEQFDRFHVSIHGIDKAAILNAPRFAQIRDQLAEITENQTVVSHTHFDRVSIAQACAHSSVGEFSCTWLDTAKVTRRAWPKFAWSGYGLENLAQEFGLSFTHHDALDDARMAGAVLLRAIDETGLSLDEWIVRCKGTLSGESSYANERRAGVGDGPLLGEVLVFTGSLSLYRTDAADLAHNAGGRVDSGVTKATTMLVVGDQDLARLAGSDKSSKHRKAETLVDKGQKIRFLAESDFVALVT